MWSKYGKSLLALLFAAITAAQAALTDGHIDRAEWVQVLIATATAAVVYMAPNYPQWPWVKTALGALIAALNVAVTFVNGGGTTSDWIGVILAALTALGVGLAPAVSTPKPPAGVTGTYAG